MALDPSYNTNNYEEQGGGQWTIGGKLNFEAGGALAIAGTPINFPTSGAHTVTSGEATATTLDIVTGLTTVNAQVVQVLRSGAVVTADAAISASGGTLTVANGGATFTLTAGDVINWIAMGDV